MTRYAKLGVLSVRWMAVGLFVLTALWVLLLAVGGWAMGSMMGAQGGADGFGYGRMMGAGVGIFLGPPVLSVSVGVLLYALSRPIGVAIASGLEE
jgi:hypothetical protein